MSREIQQRLKNRFAFIVPAEFDAPSAEMFGTEYMRSLYDVVYKTGISGKAWAGFSGVHFITKLLKAKVF